MKRSKKKLLNDLQKINEYEFENLIADIWKGRGWHTTVTRGSGDRGIDIIAEKNSPFYQKQLIQVKRYSSDNKIGSTSIQQYSSLQHQENNVDAVIVVTTSSFTKPAKITAEDLNVKLINGSKLVDMIDDESIQQNKTSTTSSTSTATPSLKNCPDCDHNLESKGGVNDMTFCDNCYTNWIFDSGVWLNPPCRHCNSRGEVVWGQRGRLGRCQDCGNEIKISESD